MDYEQGNQIRREGYEPPTVEDIPLRPDEKILAGCKVSGGPGPGVAGIAVNHAVPTGPLGDIERLVRRLDQRLPSVAVTREHRDAQAEG